MFHTQESLFTRFGFNIFAELNTKTPEPEEKRVDKWDVKQAQDFEVHGYPCSQKPYNSLWDVQKNYLCTQKHQNPNQCFVQVITL